jgi:hypothetical protein
MLYNLFKVCMLPPSSVFFDHEEGSDLFLWSSCLTMDCMMLHPKLLITTTVRTLNPVWRHNSLPARSYSLASVLYILESWKKLHCHGNALTHLAVLVQLYLIRNGVTVLPQSSCSSCHVITCWILPVLMWKPPWSDTCYNEQWNERGYRVIIQGFCRRRPEGAAVEAGVHSNLPW